MLIVFIISGNNEVLFRQGGGGKLRMEMEAVFLEAQTHNLCSLCQEACRLAEPSVASTGFDAEG